MSWHRRNLAITRLEGPRRPSLAFDSTSIPIQLIRAGSIISAILAPFRCAVPETSVMMLHLGPRPTPPAPSRDGINTPAGAFIPAPVRTPSAPSCPLGDNSAERLFQLSSNSIILEVTQASRGPDQGPSRPAPRERRRAIDRRRWSVWRYFQAVRKRGWTRPGPTAKRWPSIPIPLLIGESSSLCRADNSVRIEGRECRRLFRRDRGYRRGRLGWKGRSCGE